jgi:hemerythrin-like domain-containing protein
MRRVAPKFFENAVEFSRTFADRFHHFKEEHMHFVRLAQKRQGEIAAQLEALRHQHERGRELETEYLKIQGKEAGDTFERSHELVVDMGSALTHMR